MSSVLSQPPANAKNLATWTGTAAQAVPTTAPPALDIAQATEQLAQALARTAIERDRTGGHAPVQRALIRKSGLLALIIPTQYGGLGADFPTLFRVVRRLAEVDSALAHVFSFHHLQIASLLVYGNAEQQARLLRQSVVDELFWGNALNPQDTSLQATRVVGGWTLQGKKTFASGSVGSDRLTFSAWVHLSAEEKQQLLIGNIATRTPGIEVNQDWDSFGQRQTDSGTVQFDGVFLPDRDVLQAPGFVPTAWSTLRTQVSQLTMANLYLGIAQGAFNAARDYTLNHARAWAASGVASSAQDPYVQHRYGQLWLLIRPAQLAVDAAGVSFQEAIGRRDDLTPDERGEVAIAVAEAKVLAHRAGVEVSSQLFELTGSSSTRARFGLDRFWRNARVHTLHDPVDYKIRDIGRFRLDGQLPEPTPYS